MSAVIRAAAGLAGSRATVFESGGCAGHPVEEFSGGKPLRSIFRRTVPNFGRFPRHVKAACIACALVFKAAGIRCDEGEKRNIALLAAGFMPVLEVDREFFRDYLDGGRTMGRGNLFIYTLPTSALAEVSIYFGLTGPALYIEPAGAPFGGLPGAAQRMLEGGAEAAVLLWQDMQHTVCAAAVPESPPEPSLAGLAEVEEHASAWSSPVEALRYFEIKATRTSGV